MTVALIVHTWWRWVALLALLVRSVRGVQGWMGADTWKGSDHKLSVFTVIALDLQLTLGFVLMFTSPLAKSAYSDMGAAMGDSVLRFWAVEHPTAMVLAAVAMHVGHAVSKRATEQAHKHRAIAVGCGIALLLVLSGIPWPFREGVGRALF